jgi:hypothetical protein
VKVWIRAPFAALAMLGAVAATANAANVNTVTGKVTPTGAGSASDPLPLQVRFSLRSRSDDVANRPQPTKTYVLGMEGVAAYPGAFPACSIATLKVRKGPPAKCGKAQLGTGLVKGAAGIVEDDTMDESVPCSLTLRVYNMGNGIALRLDGDPPLPKSFKSTKIGCPVPIHTAIPAPLRKVTIDGLPSTELQFTVPKLLMKPLVGWNSALTLVDATLTKRVAGGKGYFSSTGCNGGTRTLQVGFIGVDGARLDASTEPAC